MGGSGAKQAGESEHTFPPEAFEARGAAEGCCRHLTFEMASSDGVWLAMAAVAPSCTSVYVAAATAPAPDVACGRAAAGCCRHLTFKMACSDGVWLAMAAVAPSCTSVYVAAATAPAPEVACGRAAEGCCRHLTFKRACSDGVWLAMARWHGGFVEVV
jgi:hypothetical protein